MRATERYAIFMGRDNGFSDRIVGIAIAVMMAKNAIINAITIILFFMFSSHLIIVIRLYYIYMDLSIYWCSCIDA